MAESPREDAMLAIVAIPPASMTGDRYWGAGYPNPVRVVRGYLGPEQVTEWPTLCLFEATGARMEFATTGGVGRFVDHFRVTAVGYVLGNDAQSPELWRERLYRDFWTTFIRQALPIGQIRNFDFGVEPQDISGPGESPAWWEQTFEVVIDDEVEAA